MRHAACLQVEELKERLAGTKSAPPGVDMATTTAEQDQEDAAEGGKEVGIFISLVIYFGGLSFGN